MTTDDYTRWARSNQMVRRERDQRTEFLSDIIIGAVEGGTGYWAEVRQYQYVYNGEVKVYIGGRVGDETRARLNVMDTGDEYVLDTAIVSRGLGRIKRGEVGLNSTLRNAILHGDIDNDAGDIDADCADAIVQAGLFGELVYG